MGCGSGLSGEVLTDAGHEWVGLDIRCAQPVVEVASATLTRLTSACVCGWRLPSRVPLPREQSIHDRERSEQRREG